MQNCFEFFLKENKEFFGYIDYKKIQEFLKIYDTESIKESFKRYLINSEGIYEGLSNGLKIKKIC